MAVPHPAAHIVPGSDAGTSQPVITIDIVDDHEQPVAGAGIRVAASSATDKSGANVFLTAVKDGKETPMAAPKRVTAPDFDGDGFAKSVNIFLPVPIVAGTTYKVLLRPAGGRPVLTYRVAGQQFTITETIVLEAGGPDKIDMDFLEKSAPLKSSVELGGGEDGALLSLRVRYGRSVSDNHRLVRVLANFEADLSPGSKANDSLIYGHVLGEVNGLWQVPFREGGYFQGSAFYGVVGSFESDQQFDNWDASIGLTGWWFVNCDAIRKFGDLLRLSRDKDTPVHPLSFKLSGNYIYASEREAAQKDAGDFRASARAIWLNRIYSNAALPLVAARFDVNLLVDAGMVWEPEGADMHPTARVSLEFQPLEAKDSNLSFSLTYAKGEFSPTFVDEDAFLAGLKLRF